GTAITSSGDIEVIGCTLSGNEASSSNTYSCINTTGDLTLIDCVIAGNTDYMYLVYSSSSDGVVDITGSEINGNNGCTNGIYLYRASSFEISDSRFKNNTFSQCGLYLNSNDSQISYVELSGNSSSSEFIYGNNLTILNSLVCGSTYSGTGSNSLMSFNGSSMVVNSTIYDNECGSSLFASNASTLILNSIIWNNSGSYEKDLLSQFTGTYEIYNSCIEDYSSVDIVNEADSYGTGNIDQDPLLLSTYSLSGTSPCLDTGMTDLSDYGFDTSQQTDLAGNTRLQNGNIYNSAADIDMGCFEYDIQNSVYVYSTSDIVLDVNRGSVDSSAVLTIDLASNSEDELPFTLSSEDEVPAWLDFTEASGTISAASSVSLSFDVDENILNSYYCGIYTHKLLLSGVGFGNAPQYLMLKVRVHSLSGDDSNIIVPEDYETIESALSCVLVPDGATISLAALTTYGEVTIERPVNIVGAVGNEDVSSYVISSGGSGTVFTVGDGAPGTTISGVTIKTAEIAIDNSAVSVIDEESGIVIQGLTLENSLITDITGTVITSSGDIEVIGCTLSGNEASSSNTYSCINTTGNLTLVDCVISGNTNYKYLLYSNSTAGVIDVTGSEINGNTGCTNGIYINAASRLSIASSSIYGNEYTNAGIYSNAFSNFSNCLIAGNVSSSSCAGVYAAEIAYVVNCTIAHNISSSFECGGIYTDSDSYSKVINSIIWGCRGTEDSSSVSTLIGGDGVCYISDSWVENKEDANGDLYIDPLFSDPTIFDYHLKSVAGRWNGVTETWENDSESSPCIDAGSADSDYENEPAYNGDRINLGAYGNTKYASLSGIADLVANDDSFKISQEEMTVFFDLTDNDYNGYICDFWISEVDTSSLTDSIDRNCQ
ncbi:hypothetical protein, partial [Pseudodesulfovibrio indicus]|uniref:hypothetical protein n=1 Tax=Pseudodesulfovibrio indicus TaxID=1716143 RepID=UPI002930E48A